MIKQARLLLKRSLFCHFCCCSFSQVLSAWSATKACTPFAINCKKVLCACKTTVLKTVASNSFCERFKKHLLLKLNAFNWNAKVIKTGAAFSCIFPFSQYRVGSWSSARINNVRGFALTWLTLLLPFVLAVFFVVSALLVLQSHKQELVDTCREELLSVQNVMALAGKSLLALNPQALQLRAQLTLVDQQILLALTTGQLELLPPLKVRRLLIRSQQRVLQSSQTSIVKATQITAQVLLNKSYSKLKSLMREQQLRSKNWVDSHSVLSAPPTMRFAFKPTDKNLAPTYEPYKNFERQQSLAFAWVQHFKWNPFLEKIIQQQKIRSQCRVSIREGHWKSIIQKDRL